MDLVHWKDFATSIMSIIGVIQCQGKTRARQDQV